MSEQANTEKEPSKEAIVARQSIRKLTNGVLVVSDQVTFWRAVDQEIQAAIDKAVQAERVRDKKDYFPFTSKDWPT